MRRGASLVASATALLLVAGCGGGRSGGSSVSPCFRVLPEAHAAVGGQGTFVDVARIRGRRIDLFPGTSGRTEPTTSTAPTSTAPRPDDARRDVCVVAYRGSFDPALIPQLRGTKRQGAYAVVVVGVRTQRVRTAFLTDQLPPPLRRH